MMLITQSTQTAQDTVTESILQHYFSTKLKNAQWCDCVSHGIVTVMMVGMLSGRSQC